MLNKKLKQLFKKGKLYERESFGGYIIYYNIDSKIKLQRYFQFNELDEMHDMIFDLYFTYEYDGKELSARQIALLLGCSHDTVDKILARAKNKIKTGIEKSLENGLTKSAISKNMTIFL